MQLNLEDKFKTRNGLSVKLVGRVPNGTFIGYVSKGSDIIPVNWREDGTVVGTDDSCELRIEEDLDEVLFNSLTDTEHRVLSFLYNSIAPGGHADSFIQKHFPGVHNTIKLMQMADRHVGKIYINISQVKS